MTLGRFVPNSLISPPPAICLPLPACIWHPPFWGIRPKATDNFRERFETLGIILLLLLFLLLIRCCFHSKNKFYDNFLNETKNNVAGDGMGFGLVFLDVFFWKNEMYRFLVNSNVFFWKHGCTISKAQWARKTFRGERLRQNLHVTWHAVSQNSWLMRVGGGLECVPLWDFIIISRKHFQTRSCGRARPVKKMGKNFTGIVNVLKQNTCFGKKTRKKRWSIFFPGQPRMGLFLGGNPPFSEDLTINN